MFKVGDEIVGSHPNRYGITREGWKGIVSEILLNQGTETDDIRVKTLDGSSSYCVESKYFILIKSSNSMSSLTQKVAQLFLSEPEKSFQKAGIFDSSNQLTEDGQSIFLTWLISDKDTKDKFNTAIVQPLLAQEEAEKK